MSTSFSFLIPAQLRASQPGRPAWAHSMKNSAPNSSANATNAITSDRTKSARMGGSVSRLAWPVYVPAVVTDAPRRPPPPFLYFILFLPFGATTQFVGITIVNMWSTAEVGEAALGAMVASNILPHTFKVLWAPLVDTVWNGRAWYILGNLVSSASLIATGFLAVSKQHVDLLTTLVII